MREGLQGLDSRVGGTQEWRCTRTSWEERRKRQADKKSGAASTQYLPM